MCAHASGLAHHLFKTLTKEGYLSEKDFVQMQQRQAEVAVPAELGSIPRKINNRMAHMKADQWLTLFSVYSPWIFSGQFRWRQPSDKSQQPAGKPEPVSPEDRYKLIQLVNLLSAAITLIFVRNTFSSTMEKAQNLVQNYNILFAKFFKNENCVGMQHFALHFLGMHV